MIKLSLIATISAAALLTAGCTTGTEVNAQAGAGADVNSNGTIGTRLASTTTPIIEVSTVGGAEMFGNKTIVENAMNSPIHTRLVAAVKAAGLVDALSGAGPFTVFAPTDEAFGLIPAEALDALMMPAAKDQLANLLKYHVVAGRITAADIKAKAAANGGTATYATLQGGTLSFMPQANGTLLIEGNRGKAYITQSDVVQSNGMIHVINGIMLP
ncbi:MAG: fasciclin domain-containing protein [Sphingomonadales bacterium]|nr:fasciclin domain-containing protein [Sphingomonadales bacterium]